MEFLGIGLPELFFIVLIALIVLGPKDMVKAGRTIGTWLRTVVTSPNWQLFMKTSRELRTLPNKLMREAGMDEFEKAGRDFVNESRKTLADPSFTIAPPRGEPTCGAAEPPQAEDNTTPPPTDPDDGQHA